MTLARSVLRSLGRRFGKPCMYCPTKTFATIGWGGVLRGLHVPLCPECREREVKPDPNRPVEIEAIMTTTTSYGSWFYHSQPPTLSLRQDVEQSLGETVVDFDVDAIETDYRAAINAALPEGVTLAGDEFRGPHPFDEAKCDGIAAALETAGGDFWAIVERHDKAAVAERAAAADELTALGQEMNPEGYR